MDQTEELTSLLVEFYERFSSWEQGVVRESGITLPQMHTLEVLGVAGDLRMKELAEKLGVTTGGADSPRGQAREGRTCGA